MPPGCGHDLMLGPGPGFAGASPRGRWNHLVKGSKIQGADSTNSQVPCLAALAQVLVLDPEKMMYLIDIYSTYI